jgi:excisionase family DNA binding protein
MLAVPGSRIGLAPHPAAEASERILLAEGPPDMIAARSRDLPAIAVPGDHAWRVKWASAPVGRQITVVMDSDAAGRAATGRIAESLSGHAEVQTVDLAPHRTDGYDLTDWLLEHPNLTGRALDARLAEPSSLSSTELRPEVSKSSGSTSLSALARSLPAAFDDEALQELASRLLPFLDARHDAESLNSCLLTTTAAAERVGVNVETIRRAIRAGELPVAARIGRSPRITALALDSWLTKTSHSEGAVRPARSRRSRRAAQPHELSLIAAFKTEN